MAIATRKYDVPSLTSTIEKNLSEPPCRAGLKLHSDRAIAHSLKLNVSTVRASMQLLEKRGYLLRKHGSGTYVRRLANSRTIPPHVDALPPAKLFKDYPFSRDTAAVVQPTESKLSFGMWGDLHFTSDANRQLYAAIIAHINALGHEVTFNSMFRSYREPFSVEDIAESLLQSQNDGHLVIGNCADEFNRAKQNQHVHAVFFAAGNLPLYEPMVMFDTGEAVERAFRIFVRQGYTRIGVIGLASGLLYAKPEKYIYAKEVEQHGFSYHRYVQVAQPPTLARAMDAVRSLLTEPQPPQAIYVADDNILPALVEVFQQQGLVCGHDIAVITLSNRGIELPTNCHWSRLEFDPDELAQEVIRKLLDGILHGRDKASSVSIHAHFVEGKTHLRA